MPGIGLLDLDTVAGPTRLIGNLVIDAELDGQRHRVVGFENHAGRTRLGPGSRRLARSSTATATTARTAARGASTGRVVGTYLHGPLLPKNPWLADRLIADALARRGRSVAAAPLDDALERVAQRVAEAIAAG